MKSKTFIIISLCLIYFTNLANAASCIGWAINDGLVNGNVYVKTNSATSVTLHIYCTRSTNETNFHLQFKVGTSNPPSSLVNFYASYDITSADFDAQSIGSTYLDYTRTITIDSRTQSLGDKRLTLFSGNLSIIYSPSYPMIYVPNSGTFDPFPIQYSNTLFNYVIVDNTGTPGGTTISPSDTQPVLTVGQSIYSPDHNTRLTLQTDGNLVLYKKQANGSELGEWSSGTVGKAVQKLMFQSDGNLVVYNGSVGVWDSGFHYNNGQSTVHSGYYYLQNDGNFVFYWPNYDSYLGVVSIIAEAADVTGNLSSHTGNLHHPLYSPARQQDHGSAYTTVPL